MHGERKQIGTQEEQLEGLISAYERFWENLPGGTKGAINQTVDDRIRWLIHTAELFGHGQVITKRTEREVAVLSYLSEHGAATLRDAVKDLAMRRIDEEQVADWARAGGSALGKTLMGSAIGIGYPDLKRHLNPDSKHRRGYKRR